MFRPFLATNRLPLLLALTCAAAALAPATARADALADYRAAVSADHPLAYWHLDETSGTSAADFGSVGATGTFAGALALGAGSPFGSPVNTGVNLSATGTMTAQLPGTMNSVEFWVRPSSRAAQTFVRFGDPATSTGWSIGLTGAQGSQKRRLLFTASGKTTNSRIRLSAGSWSMVYVSWGPGNKVNFAINGGGISKSHTAGGLPDSSGSSSTLVIGPGAGSGGTLIDEVAIYPGRPNSANHYSPSALPSLQSAPSITPLSGAEVGQTMTLTPGTWGAGTTVSDVWQRCDSIGACQAISGATGNSYTLQPGDAGFSIQVSETGTNSAGSITIYTDSSDAVAEPDGSQPTAPPVLPPGSDPTVPEDETQTAIDEGAEVSDPNTEGSGSGGAGSGGAGSVGSDTGGSGSGGSDSGGFGSGGSESSGSESGGAGAGDSGNSGYDATGAGSTSDAGGAATTAARPSQAGTLHACVSPALLAARSVKARLGRKAKLTMTFNVKRRTVSVRAGRRVIRRVAWTVDGKTRKGKRMTSLRLSGLGAGTHVVRARIIPRKGRAKTVTMRLRAVCS